jgi:glycosyltransferase involved in cell wall biosynthesis
MISLVIPTYNGAKYLSDLFENLKKQTYKDFNIKISDDNSNDETINVCQLYSHVLDISIQKNQSTLGYSSNLLEAVRMADREIVLLSGQDDLYHDHYFEDLSNIFRSNKKVTAISRSYFWFQGDASNVIRLKKLLNPNESPILILNRDSRLQDKIAFLSTLDQLSGLAFRNKKSLHTKFTDDVFTSHIGPFIYLLENEFVAFLNYYAVAVRTESSQSRSVSSIYEKSPVVSWAEMIYTRYKDLNQRNFIISQFVAKNYVGLFQIKNYSRKPIRYVIREMKEMVKMNKRIILDIKFIVIAILILLIPQKFTLILVDKMKPLLVRYSREKNCIEQNHFLR